MSTPLSESLHGSSGVITHHLSETKRLGHGDGGEEWVNQDYHKGSTPVLFLARTVVVLDRFRDLSNLSLFYLDLYSDFLVVCLYLR